MSNYDNTDRTAYITLGILFGVGAGVATGMLLAPKSGQEARNQLRQKAYEARDRAQTQYEHHRAHAVNKVHQAMDHAADTTEHLAEKSREGATKIRQKNDEIDAR
jgi:gas vesicle protein